MERILMTSIELDLSGKRIYTNYHKYLHFFVSVCSHFIDNFSLECASTFENDYKNIECIIPYIPQTPTFTPSYSLS